MKKIASRQNPVFKWIRRLASGKRLPEEKSLLIAEGIKLVREGLNSSLAIKNLFVSEDKYIDQLSDFSEDIIILPSKMMSQISTMKSPPGVLAVFEAIPQPIDEDFLSTSPRLVVLDSIQDPGNLGTIMRTSEAMGVDALILLDGAVSANNFKTVRASMGARFRLPVYESIKLPQLLKLLKKEKYALISTKMEGESLFNFQFPSKSALFFGKEGAGISKEIDLECTRSLAIPMQGQVESLNVATSAAICLYEWHRQNSGKKPVN